MWWVDCDDYSGSHVVYFIIWLILSQDKASGEEVDVIVSWKWKMSLCHRKPS